MELSGRLRSMARRVFTGTFPALESKILEELARSREGDPLSPALVLVGSNVLASHLKSRIASTIGTVVSFRFLTFRDLVGCLSAGSVPEKPRLAPQGRRLLLDAVLEERTPAVFRQVRDLPGFHESLLETFRDLRDAGISDTALTRGVHELRRRTPDRERHLDAVADLYHRFQSAAGEFHDVDDDFRTAITGAKYAEDRLGSSSLSVYGLYDVTGQQSDLLGALEASVDVTYYIPFVNERVSRFAEPFISAHGGDAAIAVEPRPAPGPRQALDRLMACDAGFGPVSRPDGGPASDGSVVLVSAPGDSRVAAEAVREVFRAVQDGTIQDFSEACIVLRQPTEEAAFYLEALRLRGVPFYLHGGVPLSQRPLARAVLALLALETEEYSREAVLTAFELVEAARPPGAQRWDVAEWRALSNHPRFLGGFRGWENGTTGLVEDWQRRLAVAEKGEAPEDDEPPPDPLYCGKRLRAAAELRAAWKATAAAAANWAPAQSWETWAADLDRRLRPLLESGDDWPAFEDVLGELSVLDELAARSGTDVRPGRNRVAAVVGNALSDVSRVDGRFRRSGINILGIAAARGLMFPLVIVPGLDEGRFPARLRQDPVLFDSERAAIGPGRRLPLKGHRIEEEKLLFDMLVRSAEKRLVLLSSRLDESADRERIPSEFFLRAASALAGRPLGPSGLLPGVVPGLRSVGLDNPAPMSGLPAIDEGEIRLRLVARCPDSPKRALEELCCAEPQLISAPMAYHQARWATGLTPYDGRIIDRSLADRVAGNHGPAAGPVSASRIERYAQCPYRFFLERVMGLEPWKEEEPALTLDPRDRGTAVHGILESFVRERLGQPMDAGDAGSQQARLEAIAEGVLDSLRPAGLPDLLWDVEVEGIREILRAWLAFERSRSGDGLTPAEVERAFGELEGESTAPPFRIEAGAHVFQFRGRIDRIDRSSDGTRARVIDYKVGKLPDKLRKKERPPLMAGEKIQIALYAAAVRDVLDGREGLVSIEGEYLHLQPADGEVACSCHTGPLLARAFESLPGTLAVVGDGIVSGAFFAKTSSTVRTASPCEFCDYKVVCGRDRVAREELKSGDPAVRRFAALAGDDSGNGEDGE